MTPAQARATLAADVSAALPDGWTVYSEPPEGVTAPAVALGPRTPYRVKSTVCNEQVRLTATVLVQRASGPSLDYMDDVVTIVRDAVHGSSAMAVVESVQSIGTVLDVGSVEYLAAVLDIIVEV